MKTYPSKEAAIEAATKYQKKNGGEIVEGGRFEHTNDRGRIIGAYEFVAVAQGSTEDNPMGDS